MMGITKGTLPDRVFVSLEESLLGDAQAPESRRLDGWTWTDVRRRVGFVCGLLHRTLFSRISGYPVPGLSCLGSSMYCPVLRASFALVSRFKLTTYGFSYPRFLVFSKFGGPEHEGKKQKKGSSGKKGNGNGENGEIWRRVGKKGRKKEQKKRPRHFGY